MKKYQYLLLSFLILLADQVTKFLVRVYIDAFDTIKIFPFLQLVSVRNEGAAFGMFKGFGNSGFIIISLIAIAVVLYLLVRIGEDRFALSLILGGATGNLIDRIVFKKVTDFIDVFAGKFHWPAFNIADSALTVGLIVMLLNSFFRQKSRGKS